MTDENNYNVLIIIKLIIIKYSIVMLQYLFSIFVLLKYLFQIKNYINYLNPIFKIL